MTTIAFDGKTLAVDRASWKGNYIWTPVQKLFIINQLGQSAADRFGLEKETKIAYAGAGSAADVPLVVSWMMGRLTEIPKDLEKDEDNTSRGLILSIDSRRIYALTGILTLESYTGFPVADGGGHQMALGAMLAGATAVQAIEFSAARSSWAAGGVDSYTLPEQMK